MKKFTTEDLENRIPLKHETWMPYRKLCATKEDLINNPLWYHKRRLMQTSSGYGDKLVTEWMIHFEGLIRRVYCACHSNCGMLYFFVKGEKIILDVW